MMTGQLTSGMITSCKGDHACACVTFSLESALLVAGGAGSHHVNVHVRIWSTTADEGFSNWLNPKNLNWVSHKRNSMAIHSMSFIIS